MANKTPIRSALQHCKQAHSKHNEQIQPLPPILSAVRGMIYEFIGNLAPITADQLRASALTTMAFDHSRRKVVWNPLL